MGCAQVQSGAERSSSLPTVKQNDASGPASTAEASTAPQGGEMADFVSVRLLVHEGTAPDLPSWEVRSRRASRADAHGLPSWEVRL